jgi:hypothetical protein
MEELPEAGYSPLYNGHSPPYSDDITDALRVRTPRGRQGQGQEQEQGSSAVGRGRERGKGELEWERPNQVVPNLSLSPVMRTASPYTMTPGPPSFSVGKSRDFGPAFFHVESDP